MVSLDIFEMAMGRWLWTYKTVLCYAACSCTVLLHQFTHNICIIHFLHPAFYVTLSNVNKTSLLVKSFSLKMV